jgi:hypothetical protein
LKDDGIDVMELLERGFIEFCEDELIGVVERVLRTLSLAFSGLDDHVALEPGKSFGELKRVVFVVDLELPEHFNDDQNQVVKEVDDEH